MQGMDGKIPMKLKKYDDTFIASETMAAACVWWCVCAFLCIVYMLVLVSPLSGICSVGFCVHADLKHFCTALLARFQSKRTQTTKPKPHKK